MPSAIEVSDSNGTIHTNDDLNRYIHDYAENTINFGKYLHTALPEKTGNAVSEEQKTQLAKGVGNYPAEKPYQSVLSGAPVTVERQLYYPKEGDRLLDPGTARANLAVSLEAPEGTTQDDWAKKHAHETVLQQHVAYWDPDADGIIWPTDTYRGLRNWGWAIPLSLFATFVISGLSYPTVPSWTPDPFFRIYVTNIHKAKHASDSTTYDAEGRFKGQSFEDFFAKYDRGNKGGLSAGDLARAHKGQRAAFDFFGWLATALEWTAVYLLLWPEDGICRKDDIRRVFDGSIFQHKADEYAAKQKKKNKKTA